MSIDKFGSNIFGNDKNSNHLPTSSSNNNNQLLTVVDVHNVKLFYNLVLPFIGQYNKKEKLYELTQDKRLTYVYPLSSCFIVTAEFPKNQVYLKINNIKIGVPEGMTLNTGDIISFGRQSGSDLSAFYGELLIKCQVVVES